MKRVKKMSFKTENIFHERKGSVCMCVCVRGRESERTCGEKCFFGKKGSGWKVMD